MSLARQLHKFHLNSLMPQADNQLQYVLLVSSTVCNHLAHFETYLENSLTTESGLY